MPKLSTLAETLIGSEIVKLGNEINNRIKAGENIYNFTIGDFNSTEFPIPAELKEEIIKAYNEGYTTYPTAEGIVKLREGIAHFTKKYENLDYDLNEIQVASGGRPLIYSIYRTLVDDGDKVIYPVPSWNNNHYTHFTKGTHISIETIAENNFMPTAAEIKPHIKGATLLSLCSPLNPTGTTFGKQQLHDICQLVLDENNSRKADEKKMYVLYDQIYYTLTHGNTEHYNPVSLLPAMKQYTVFVDGISKSFAATGVRVGWSMGPEKIISKIKAILSHVGAWAPMAEQVAVANYLLNDAATEKYLQTITTNIEKRLNAFYTGFQSLKNEGFTVDAIAPEAAIYLTIKFDLKNKTTEEGKQLATQMDVWQYILDEAKVAVVPFSSFGASKDSVWYRLSVGTSKTEEIPTIINQIRTALQKLK